MLERPRIIDLMLMSVPEVEQSTLDRYKRAVAIDVNPRLDRAILIPPKKSGVPFVLLVAHTDTVFTGQLSREEIGQRGPVLYSKHEHIGLGADDRAGIAACFDIYDQRKNVAVLLCPNEESGCEGSHALRREYLEKHLDLDKLCYVLQFDRRGNSDIVTYDVGSMEFEEYLGGHLHGFTPAAGSFSDIVALCPKLGVCGANLSIGYENEHTADETLDVLDYHRTVLLVSDMLKNTAASMPRFDLIGEYREHPDESSLNDLYDELYGEHTAKHGEIVDLDDQGNAIRWDAGVMEAINSNKPPTDDELQIYFSSGDVSY